MIRRESSIKHDFIKLDEMTLEEGDWIEIGSSFKNIDLCLVTVKGLVFSKNRESS